MMKEENKNVISENKIHPIHISEQDIEDPGMDRFVRESLVEEADEIAEQLEQDPNLVGIEAPDGMYDAIVGKLKMQGDWEEEEDLETIYAKLPEEDRRTLELGRQVEQERQSKAGKRKRTMKILKRSVLVAAILVLVFSVGMTSEANRRLVLRMWDGILDEFGFRVDTDYSNDGESVRSKNNEEMEALEDIRESLGSPVIKFGYLPIGMEYQGYDVVSEDYSAVMFYVYQEKIFNVTIVNLDQEGTFYYTYDNEAVLRDKITNYFGIDAEIWEVNLNLEEETYMVEIEYEGWRYILNGMISIEELEKIIEYIDIL